MARSSPNPSTAGLVDRTLAVAADAPIVTLALSLWRSHLGVNRRSR